MNEQWNEPNEEFLSKTAIKWLNVKEIEIPI